MTIAVVMGLMLAGIVSVTLECAVAGALLIGASMLLACQLG